MIYVPNKENYKCFVVQNEEVIRAYVNIPNYNTNVSYRDFYIRSDYIFRDGVQQFSNYTTLPTCLDNSIVTDSFYYRVDFDKILVIFIILAIVCFIVPLKIFLRLFRRFQ